MHHHQKELIFVIIINFINFSVIINYIIPNLFNFTPYNLYLDITSSLAIKFHFKNSLDYVIDIDLV